MTKYLVAVMTLALFEASALVPACQSDQGFRVKLSVGVHQYILDNSVNFDGYNIAVPPASLGGATRLIADRDDHSACRDFPVCLNLVATSVSGFGSSSSSDGWLNLILPDKIAAADLCLAMAPPNYPNVKVTGTITVGNTPEDGIAVGDSVFSFFVRFSAENATWAHEFGHACGLEEGDQVAGLCPYNLMMPPGALNRDQLTQGQEYIIENAISVSSYAQPEVVACEPTGVAGFNGISAVASPFGVEVTFYTLWEENTESFEVRRVDPTSGAVLYTLATPVATPYANLKKYATPDPNGAPGSIYQIVEHQTSGLGDLFSGPISALEEPSSSTWNNYDADSLAAIVSTYYDGSEQVGPGRCLTFPPQYAILCPDSFLTALNSYASLWRARGVSTEVFYRTFADGCPGGYNGLIHQLASQGTQYFLLVGDASDYVWWDSLNIWPSTTPTLNGRHIPPSQPAKDLISTYYTRVTGNSPSSWWTFSTPYYASDVPYADLDSDGLPDIIIGRLPASSVADVNSYTAKLQLWLQNTNGNIGSTAGVFTYAVYHDIVPAWVTAFAKDSLISAFPPAVSVTQASYVSYESDPLLRPSIPDSVGTLFRNATSGTTGVIVINSNASYRYGYQCFMNVTTLPLPITPRPFVSLALTCGTNDFDETEEYDQVCSGGACTYVNPKRPLIERALFSANRGPITQIGPTRASFVRANPLFGQEFIQRLYQPGGTVGKAFLLAQRICALRYPEYRDLFRSYVLLGDPRLGPNAVTEVRVQPAPQEIQLTLPRPNPFNPETRLRFYLGQAGRASISIFDVQGRLVRLLVREGVKAAGWTEVRWNGETDRGLGAGSGVYFARLSAGGSSVVQRLVLLR